MSETEATAIDEKKAEDSGSTTDKADWKAFSKNFSHGLITGIFFGVIVIGSMGLFLAKVANANILPTDCDIQPYPSDNPIDKDDLIKARDVATDIIYMNPVKILGFFGLGFWMQPQPNDKAYYIQEANFVNQKAELNFMDDFNSSWLCGLKNKAYPPKGNVGDTINTDINPSPNINTSESKTSSQDMGSSGSIRDVKNNLPQNSPFWAYEFKTLKAMTCNSFSIINKMFFYMNYLPEWATMFIFALFFSVIIMIVYVANMFYGFWAHLSNFGELVKNLYDPKDFNKGRTYISDPEEANKKWYQKWSTITYPLYVFAYLIGGFYSALLISPGLVTFYAFFKALGATYVVRDKNFNDEPKDAPKLNVFSFIKSALYYKKTFIIILVMLNLMATTNEYLGTSYLPGVIIALIILIFGLKVLEISPPEELYPVLNSNFPPLTQPKLVPNSRLPEVNVCIDKPTPVSEPDKIIKTVTGFEGPDVLQKNEFRGGGRALKNSVIKSVTNVIKSKTKLYNLKLV